MLYNYLKIALRNIVKHKGYSFINVFGLAIGIACCLLIFLFVKDELTYDHFHSKVDRIYRVASTLSFAGNETTMGSNGFPEGQAYLEGIPEVENMVRLDNDQAIIQKGDDYISQTGLIYTDQSIFDIFDFEVLDGSSDNALSGLSNIVITERTAIKYFGKTEVTGETLRMNVEDALENYTIMAVIDDHPSNSSFNFDIMIPWAKRESQLNNYRLTSWGNISINTYLLVSEGADIASIEAKMREIREERNPGEGGAFARQVTNVLQPMKDIHLNTDLGGGDGIIASTDPQYSYILSGIALIILIVACINFTNLSVARSLPRAKEIGVRKVLGAHRKQVAFQFLNEALLMCMIAFVLGLILAELALPVFGPLIEKTFYHGVTSDPVLMLSCLGLVLITAFLSGFYPSFIVSRFNTVISLKGKVRLKGNRYISKGLVVIQFTIAGVLIIGTIAMNRQIDYMINMDLGYDDENLIRIQSYQSGTPNLSQLFKDELAKNPNIIAVAAADNYNSATGAEFDGKEFFSMYNDIDENYLQMIDIEVLEGRNLRKGKDLYTSSEDTLTNILINQAFVKESGLEDPIYKTFNGFRIVGIVPDYYYQAVNSEISPLMLISADETGTDEFMSIFVKFKPEYLPKVMTVIEDTWRKYVPYRPFEGYFVEEANGERYAEDVRWKKIITYASILAISISALGLFGLAHLATQQRIKEIGIRKVLGASVGQVVLLLNANFSRLVLLSVILATPIAYYFIDKWLQDFANPINLTVLLFLVPGLVTFGIALVTVTLQSLKSANSNPVDSLRYE